MRIDHKQFGPSGDRILPIEDAKRWCREQVSSEGAVWKLAIKLAPEPSRDAVAALGVFACWTEAMALEEVAADVNPIVWWAHEVESISDTARHPSLVVLRELIEQGRINTKALSEIVALARRERDVNRYNKWSSLMAGYQAAGGALIELLMSACGDGPSDHAKLARNLGAGILLTRRWRSVGRDFRVRDLLVIPTEVHSIEDFETRLLRSGKLGYGCDQAFLGEFRDALRACVEKTWPLLECADDLVRAASASRPLIWFLLAITGQALRQVEMWNYETALYEPGMSPLRLRFLAWRARSAPPFTDPHSASIEPQATRA